MTTWTRIGSGNGRGIRTGRQGSVKRTRGGRTAIAIAMAVGLGGFAVERARAQNAGTPPTWAAPFQRGLVGKFPFGLSAGDVTGDGFPEVMNFTPLQLITLPWSPLAEPVVSVVQAVIDVEKSRVFSVSLVRPGAIGPWHELHLVR